MRDIKFRAWDLVNKQYIPHELLEVGVKNMNKTLVKRQFIYEQFTGLTDKNGKEIYESDEVLQYIRSEFLDLEDWENIKGVVKMINGCWCVGESQYPLFGFESEIISNINENQ